jgi:hypothetical protein
MPHASHISRPKEGGLVTLRSYVPAEIVTLDGDEALISTGGEGVIRVPQTLMAESDEPGFIVFEGQMPSDVAAAVRSTCEQLFGQTFIETPE